MIWFLNNLIFINNYIIFSEFFYFDNLVLVLNENMIFISFLHLL